MSTRLEYINELNLSQDIRHKSIIINGPIGSGKGIISKALAKKLNMPVISTDVFRFLPEKEYFINKGFENLTDKEKALLEYRKLLPNLPNYEQLGFNQKFDNMIAKQFGLVAWHFYQKQFETKLLTEIFKQLKTPSIIDLGGGMGISLDKDYERFEEKARNLDENLFNKCFPLKRYVGFDKIKGLLSQFDNVVYLQLPSNYQDYMEKAASDRLNPVFISTGQYQETATQTISVRNLIFLNQVNWNRVDKLTDEIISNCQLEIPKNEDIQIKK